MAFRPCHHPCHPFLGSRETWLFRCERQASHASRLNVKAQSAVVGAGGGEGRRALMRKDRFLGAAKVEFEQNSKTPSSINCEAWSTPETSTSRPDGCFLFVKVFKLVFLEFILFKSSLVDEKPVATGFCEAPNCCQKLLDHSLARASVRTRTLR